MTISVSVDCGVLGVQNAPSGCFGKFAVQLETFRVIGTSKIDVAVDDEHGRVSSSSHNFRAAQQKCGENARTTKTPHVFACLLLDDGLCGQIYRKKAGLELS